LGHLKCGKKWRAKSVFFLFFVFFLFICSFLGIAANYLTRLDFAVIGANIMLDLLSYSALLWVFRLRNFAKFFQTNQSHNPFVAYHGFMFSRLQSFSPNSEDEGRQPESEQLTVVRSPGTYMLGVAKVRPE
jgi:hypothetical protein